MFLHATWMFLFWSIFRVIVTVYIHHDGRFADELQQLVTDVDVHTLRLHGGADLFFLLLTFASVAVIAQTIRGRPVLLPTVGALVVAGTLGLASSYYPALTLSGRVASPFTGPERTSEETVAFSIAGMFALGVVILLTRQPSHSQNTHDTASVSRNR
jgi:hypothetical protein